MAFPQAMSPGWYQMAILRCKCKTRASELRNSDENQRASRVSSDPIRRADGEIPEGCSGASRRLDRGSWSGAAWVVRVCRGCWRGASHGRAWGLVRGRSGPVGGRAGSLRVAQGRSGSLRVAQGRSGTPPRRSPHGSVVRRRAAVSRGVRLRPGLLDFPRCVEYRSRSAGTLESNREAYISAAQQEPEAHARLPSP